MAKKKLFGNVKEPRCETCAHGKLSANGESVLCVQGGAVPLTYSCRRYQYDPLRRIPKRRPQLEGYTAADFALDETTATEQPITTVTESSAETAPEPTADRSALDHLFAYLDTHETPNADTIRAILTKTYDPQADEDHDDECESPLSDEEILSQVMEEASQAAAALAPDDSPAIDGDLERLDITAVTTLARESLGEARAPIEPLFLPADAPEDTEDPAPITAQANAPLSASDLLFLPKGTPSDHDGEEPIGGFTPLTINE